MSRGLHFWPFLGTRGFLQIRKYFGGGDGNSVVATFLSENPSGAPMIWRAGSCSSESHLPKIGEPTIMTRESDPEVLFDHNGPHRK